MAGSTELASAGLTIKGVDVNLLSAGFALFTTKAIEIPFNAWRFFQ